MDQLASGNAGIRQKIRQIILRIVADVGQGTSPNFVLAYNRWSNTDVQAGILQTTSTVNKRVDFRNSSQLNHFRRIVETLKTVYALLLKNQLSTVRQIYYENLHLFNQQAELSVVLENICRLLECSRRDLNIIATAKGLVCGDLAWKIADGTEWITSYSTPVLIPNDFRSIKTMKSNANVVLVVEKDAVFQRLIDDDFIGLCKQRGLRILLVTGKGVPDICTRELLYILRNDILEKTARFYILTDADSFGIEIAAIYSFGSLSQAARQNLAVPSLKWIGLYPSEVERYDFDWDSRVTMSRLDLSRAKAISNRPWIAIRPSWKDEVQKLLKTRQKAEIQALESFGSSFITKGYLLRKILKDSSDDPNELLKL